MTGQRLSHYEILEKLGEGGMGIVYKARDLRLGRLVAIKVLPPARILDHDRKRRFIHEAKAASALNHPNIVTVYDIGEENGVDYIVMEYVPGRTLESVIPKIGMRLGDALSCAIALADGLAKAHAAGIVHRDLKPGNVLLDDSGTPKLLDFGLAKLTEGPLRDGPVHGQSTLESTGPSTEDGTILGTAAYMSPEQAEGKVVDARSDIFSFGLLLYEMMTGKRAFTGESRIAILSAILREEPKSPGTLVPALPREAERLIKRCLRKDPAKRWQTMADVRTSLQEIKEDSDSGFSQPAIPHASQKLFRWGMLLWGLLVVMIAAVIGSVFSPRNQPSSSTELLRPVPLTTLPGTERHPSFSPDGTQLAFDWDRGGEESSDIYVKRIGPGEALRLTQDTAEDQSPDWSPDGNLIAFLRAKTPQRWQLILIPPLGGPERVLSEISAPGITSILSVKWTKDSKAVVVFDRPPSQPGGLWIIPLDGGDHRRLTTLPSGLFGEAPLSFSADGRSLILSRQYSGNNHELFLIELTEDFNPSGEPRQLTDHNESIWGAQWIPETNELLYSSGWPGAISLWRISVTEPYERRRVTEPGEDAVLTVAARGNRLAFTRYHRDIDIYRAALSPKGADVSSTEPLIVSTRLDRWGTYSPDGKRIAFASTRSGSWQLWVCNDDGQAAIALTSLSGGEVNGLSWSRDSRYIRFSLSREVDGEAYVIESAGGIPRKLGESGLDPDEFVSPRTSVESQFRYMRRGGSIARVPLQGGIPHELFEVTGLTSNLIETSRGLYVVNTTSATNAGVLLFFRFPAGPLTKVEGVENPGLNGLSISPDGQFLLYSKVITNGGDLMLVENFK